MFVFCYALVLFINFSFCMSVCNCVLGRGGQPCCFGTDKFGVKPIVAKRKYIRVQKAKVTFDPPCNNDLFGIVRNKVLFDSGQEPTYQFTLLNHNVQNGDLSLSRKNTNCLVYRDKQCQIL